MRERLCVLWVMAIVLLSITAFLCSGILVINMTPHCNGMGNHMFRYAAGMGLIERGFDVCWSNYSWDRWRPPSHPNSFFLQHVYDPGSIPECSMLTGLLALLVLPRYAPPFSHYVPFRRSGFGTLLDGPMESFRYFPIHAPKPLFRLKQRAAAERWMSIRNLTSAVHVRRGDYTECAATLEYYNSTGVKEGVVVTDDPEWVQQHPSVFGRMVISKDADPGFDMALLATATDTVVIGVGTFGWWGAYLSSARRVIYYGKQAGYQVASNYIESDRMPDRWIKQ